MRSHEYKRPLVAGSDLRRKLLAEFADHKTVVHDGRKDRGVGADSIQEVRVPFASTEGDKACGAGYRPLRGAGASQKRTPQVRHEQRSDVLRSGCWTGGIQKSCRCETPC